MKLKKLTTENFRQFYGTQTVEFDTTSDSNVCVIYAANGAGKTTILNAFTWALFKKLSEDFEYPDQLINHKAWGEVDHGAHLTARVSVVFEHGGRVYTASRIHQARKGNGGEQILMKDGDLSLRYIEENGEAGEHSNPSNAIDQILPERLHRFFFFNGERIEHLVKPTAYEEIEAAIKTLLGLEVVDRGRRHLEDAIKTLQREFKIVGSGESQAIIDELDELRTGLEKEQSERENVSQRLQALKEERDAISDRLRAMENTRALQEKRDQLERRVAESKKREDNLRESLGYTLNEKGFSAFTEDLEKIAEARVEENRLKGELPAPLKRQFVEDLLGSGECICGTHLEPGQPHYEKVADWRRRAGIADVEASLIMVASQVQHFAGERTALNETIGRVSADISSEQSNRSQLGEELDEVSAHLQNTPLEEANQLEARRNSVERQIEDIQLARSQHDAEILAKERAIKIRERDLDRLHEQNAKAELAQRRVRAATEARDVLGSLHTMRTQDVRRDLDELIREVYRKISFKPYRPLLTEDFQLELRQAASDEPVAQSTGENQILSLSFVGALAETARRKHENDEPSDDLSSLLGFEGGSYPIVMDAAFGALDENYRRDVAQALPQLADQVIVLVSKSQGLGAVQEELLSRMSSQYVIHYHTPKVERENETIHLGGSERPYISRSSDGSEWASIERVV